MKTFVPENEEQVAEFVRAALDHGNLTNITGAGSRSGLGHPCEADLQLSTSGLTGIKMYEPSELVITALAGTPLCSIMKVLDEQDQEMAFEPIRHGALYGNPRDAGTIGGLVGVNASGPRRIKAGAARDHLLGFRAINGRGDVFQSGGRVMKNVTGYDLCKLMAGSYGTLGILSEVTLKVLPKAETELTVLIVGLDEETAVETMTQVSGRHFEVSGFAHLPATRNGFSTPAPAALADKPLTALRLEGPEISVGARKKELMAFLSAPERSLEELDDQASRPFWADIRDVVAFAGRPEQVWRISTPPGSGARLVEALLAREIPIEYHFYDWAGGLIWLAVAPARNAHAENIRDIVNSYSGHATLVRADDDVRAAVPVFHPQPTALAALTQRVRRSFDPELIFNRGRLRGDL